MKARAGIVAVLAWGCGPSPAKQPSAPSSACSPPSAAVQRLVVALDADADELHLDYTPVVDLLLVEREETRMHAQRVVEGVAANELGFRAGQGFRDEYAEEQTAQVAHAIDYAFDAAPSARRAAAQRWRAWLASPSVVQVDGPSRAELSAALERVRPQLASCGEPVDLTVTFASTGDVSSVFGTASTDPAYRNCLAVAVANVRVPRFRRASLWTHFPW